MTMTIDVARDFSRYPMGRYRKDGPKTGEHFREDVLLPRFRTAGSAVEVKLDGTLGYGSSFLEEAFGGLVRSGIPAQDVLHRLRLVSQDDSLIHEIETYVREAVG